MSLIRSLIFISAAALISIYVVLTSDSKSVSESESLALSETSTASQAREVPYAFTPSQSLAQVPSGPTQSAAPQASAAKSPEAKAVSPQDPREKAATVLEKKFGLEPRDAQAAVSYALDADTEMHDDEKNPTRPEELEKRLQNWDEYSAHMIQTYGKEVFYEVNRQAAVASGKVSAADMEVQRQMQEAQSRE